MLIASITASSALVANAQNSEYVFKYSNTNGYFKPIDVTPQFNQHNAFNLDKGSFTFRLKNSVEFSAFFGAANPQSTTEYISFYSLADKTNDTFGVEIRKGANLIPNNSLKIAIPRTENEFRNITYTFDKDNNEIAIYVDGDKVHSYKGTTKFFNDFTTLANATIGRTLRSNSGNNKTWQYVGDINYADFNKNVLTAEQIKSKHQELNSLEAKRLPMGAVKTTAENLFTPNNQVRSYRIPSLLTTQSGVVIAAIDKRNQHYGDWGNIDTAIRRSFDNGKTWQEEQVILDLVSQSYGSKNSAFLIDPLMVQDKRNGRIFMLLDMFPEMQGLFNFPNHGEGTGYKKIAGKHYRLLTDKDGNHYTVRENGIVYDESNKPTEYRVVVEGEQKIAYQDLGNLYDKNNNLLGNIFLNSDAPAGHQSKKAPLMAKKTSHLWLVHSDDDGATWSNPVDITPQVKADWMKFLGVGPGTGIQLKNGNLVMPVYYTNNIDNHLASQSAAVIISRDGGVTWERGESPMDRWAYEQDGTRELSSGLETTESQLIELDNGELKLFSRNKLSTHVIISTSKDGGYTWQNSAQVDDILVEPYSQLSVIKYSKKINGKEIVIFANPFSHPVQPEARQGRGARKNGRVWLGEVQPDGSIEWKYNTTITTDAYAYNSLTELPDGRIGLLYEGIDGIKYVALNLQELVWHDNHIYRDNRDPDNKEVSLNSTEDETFYKIGDGEMVKVGEGENLAHLVIQEGTATLSQSADSNGTKQAYASVLVEQQGKVRLGDTEQVPLNKLYLNNGTLDVNGNILTLNAADQLTNSKDASNNDTIYGNIVNEKAEEGTFIYNLAGTKNIVGNLGNNVGKLNFTYQPNDANSTLSINGNTILNVVDVQSGRVSYLDNTTHTAKTLELGQGATLALGSNTTTTLSQANLATNSQLLANVGDDKTSTLTVNTAGEGKLVKDGTGLLQLSGNLAHSGQTVLNQGKMEFNGTQSNGDFVVGPNTVLGGTADIQGNSTWKEHSRIEPGFNQGYDNFAAQIMKFANVVNEGARVLLRVENNDNKVETWKHDQLLIRGDLQTEKAIPVDLQFWNGIPNMPTDNNKDGQYGVDEGISLIQVAGASDVSKFTLGDKSSVQRSANLYNYELVSVDKELSNVADSQFDGKKFYDYRLQYLLVDENGNHPEPVIRAVSKSGSSTTAASLPSVSNEDIIRLLNEEKAKAEEAARQANDEKEKAEEAKAKADDALAKALAAQNATQAEIEQARQDKAAADAKVENANVLKAKAEEAARKAEAARIAAENALKAQQAKEQGQYRTAINAKVPSYLVANNAIFNHGDTIRRQFMDNLWAEDKKGFYVNQQNGNSVYTSNLGFTEYGYGYKGKHSSTLFGGFVPVSEHTELHAAVGFGKQTVTPKAADGASQTDYKSTSFLVGLHNKWDSVLLNTVLGYHTHRGKVSTAEEQNAGRIEAKQLQLSTEVGYEIPVGNLTVTPTAALIYQQVKTSVNDRANGWNVDTKPYNVFSQQLGTNISWKNDVVRLSAGAFFEHNNAQTKDVRVKAGQQVAQFATGRQGDALVFKLNSDFSLTKQLSLGLRVEHRQPTSDAKLRQTQFGGKLEYKF